MTQTDEDRQRDLQRCLVAACFTDLSAAGRYLDEHPDAREAVDGVGETALHYLAVENHLEGVRFLAARGAAVNTRAVMGTPPLHSAARLDYADMVRLLLSFGADPNATDDNQDTPLHAVTQSGGAAVTVALIAAGADVAARNSLGDTPLHEAASWANAAVAEALLAAGADPEATSWVGTPVLAARSCDGRSAVRVLELLVAHGARLDAVDDHGQTLMHSAAYRGDVPLLMFLVGKGLDDRAADARGGMPLDEAESEGHQAAAAYLRGLRPDTRTS